MDNGYALCFNFFMVPPGSVCKLIHNNQHTSLEHTYVIYRWKGYSDDKPGGVQIPFDFLKINSFLWIYIYTYIYIYIYIYVNIAASFKTS